MKQPKDNSSQTDVYNQVKSIIDAWPEWKKEIYQRLVKLTT